MENNSNIQLQYFIILYLPLDYEEADIQILAENAFDTYLAVITDHNDEDNPTAWRIKWLVNQIPDLSELADSITALSHASGLSPSLQVKASDFIAEDVPDIDWLQKSIEAFSPFSIGRFVIYGSHNKQDISLKKDQIGLEINATTAFGTGKHATTEGCLLALEYLHKKGTSPKKILDMGCGTAILAIAAAKLWPESQILGVDNDPVSIPVAQDHIETNASKNCHAIVGDGFQAPEIDDFGPSPQFDLILANILAAPLKHMAKDLAQTLKDGGYAILSGLLQTQEKDLLKSYEDYNLTLQESYHIDKWSALLLQKNL